MAERTIAKLKKYMNLGTLIFLIIVLYLSVCIFRYLGKEKLAVYEVSSSDITESISGTGIILRKEQLCKTEQGGYVNYYLKDGSHVKKGGTVYIIDTSGKLQSGLSKLIKEKENVSSEEKSQIIEDLKALGDSFSDDSFSVIYEAKNNISRDLMSYSDTLIADHKQELKEKYGENCYIEVAAGAPGMVSFSSDGLENLKMAEINESLFDERPKMNNLRSSEKSKAGTSVYRLVTSQEWKLVLPVNKDNYNRMKDLEEKDITNVQVTFRKDNFSVKAPYQCKKKKDGYYVVLTFDNYVQRYLDQRYLSVELLLSETEGLKIPASSLTNKKVFKIPSRLLEKGSDSDKNQQVNLMTVNKKGEKVLHQKTVKVYNTVGDMVYISASGLEKGDIIADVTKKDRYELPETTDLPGVYVVNRGYAVFEPVEISERNEDYCIIDVNENSIELYDRVILNSDTIKENQVIY